MRVVHVVCSDRFAGVERHIGVLSASLAERGVEVIVVGGDPTAMARALTPAGIRHIPAMTPRDASRALAAIERADVVNSHMTDADVVASRHVRRLRARQVSTRHFAAVRGARPIIRPALRWLLRDLAAQVSVSHFVAAAVEGASEVVHPGVADAPAGTDRGRTVLLAQRLEREKNTDAVLTAWSRTAARHGGWRMTLAGDGAERPALEALAGRLGVADSVDFLGFRSDVQDLMARAGILLAPARDEAYGLSVVEAMARATPVIATATGGHLETAGGADVSALYQPDDADAAAELIDALASDAAGRHELGAALRRRQRQAFTSAGAAARTLDVYEKALG